MATLQSKLVVSLKDMVTGPARGLSATMARLRRQGDRTSGALLGGGKTMIGSNLRGLLAIGAGYYGITKALGGTVGASIKFEEAFSNVKKVLNGTPAQLSQVRSQILEMSKQLPNSAEGLTDIFAAAAQSNIPFQELGKFSEMVAKVAVAWDVTEGQTSDALAKIKNQLNMNVDQIGLYSDAINHLGNNTAAAAPDLVDFSKRVAAQGDLFGFTATQTLAFGGAMIAAGGQTNVAATSFRNMGNALTVGANASKKVRGAFAQLGLDAVKTSKKMQKDAIGTTLDTLDRIQKLPEWQRITVARALFGDEARALMPVISNATELRRQLGLVATEGNYAGSAVQEFEQKAATTANSLKLLGNRIRAIGIGIGDGWAPTIKDAADGIGDVLVTLNKRVGILDDIRAAFEGFFGGLGGVGKDGEAGGIRKVMNDLGDTLFGEAFTGSSKDVDERVSGLAHLSNRMREIGANFRQFGSDLSAGNLGTAMKSLGAALSDMSGAMTVGGAIAIGAVGGALILLGKGALALTFSKAGQIAIMAMAVSSLINAVKDAGSLGEFVENLSDLSTMELTGIAAALGIVGFRIWSIVGGLKAWKVAKDAAQGAPKTSAETSPKPLSQRPSRPGNWKGPWGDGEAPGMKPKVGRTGPRGIGSGKANSPLPDWMNKGKPSSATTIIDEVKGLFGKGSTPAWMGRISKGIKGVGLEWLGEGLIADAFRAAGVNPTLGGWGEAQRSFDESRAKGLPREDAIARYNQRPDTEASLMGMMKWFWNKLPGDLTKPIGSVANGPSEVSLLGTPPVSIAGTPNVTMTNPPPRPNVIVHSQIDVHGITDLDMIGRHLRSIVNDAASGIQADVGYMAGQ